MSAANGGISRVSVLGAGAWGIALANLAARAGLAVTLWARDGSAVARMRERREGTRLPGIRIEPQIAITGDLAQAADTQAILLVVPAQALREVAASLHDLIPSGTPVIACAKGIERGTHRFMTEVIAEGAQTALPAILSGPSFAADVAGGLPTAVTLAAKEPGLAEKLSHALGSATFRPYHTSDVRGVEIGGAAKNVLAIAAGIVAGRGLGASAAAALTTRGFAELFRFGRAFGARPETLTGLSGLGDLILTCSGPQSRNYSLGLALGKGLTLSEAGGGKLAEGAFTAPALLALAGARGVEMPIAQAVAAVLDGSLKVDEAIEALMSRPFRAET
ncbi:MAG TPA: NAD(P)H-dependent glycerol-3-phosphate dehydrogenase [Pseudolabrys sp.]|nr:NAD(P)H-dependent glycerol-3-phosphate dehydrogenase [Pseudolabrys sp.]